MGFGGSKWTRSYSLGYLKYIVSVGFKLMVTQLVICVGTGIVMNWLAWAAANTSTVTIKGLLLLASVSVIQAILVGKIPQIAQGLIQGADMSGGGSGLAGAAQAAGTTGRTITSVSSMARNMASSSVGVVRASSAAVRAASQRVNAMQANSRGAEMGRAARIGAVAKIAGGMLARQAVQDFGSRNSGTGTSRGTLGGRVANSIKSENKK
jgi:type IV secretory pathway TrbL component